MSWRSGADLFGKIWPLLREHISDKRQRREFLVGLLRLFLENDLDPETVSDLHPEVYEALASLGVDLANEEVESTGEVEAFPGVIRQLSDAKPTARVDAALWLREFAPEMPSPVKAASSA